MTVRRPSRALPFVLLLLVLLPCACGSAPLPLETFWRLSLPVAASLPQPGGPVLRVHDLQLANALQGDCLVVADGATRLVLRDYDRWIAPLDRLVTDAVVLGLSRTGRFALVKTAGDAGPADVELHGRVLDFAETARDGGDRCARAVLEVWLERDGALLLRDEIAAEAELDGDGAAPAVAALSQALHEVVATLAARLAAADTAAAAPAK